MKKIYCMIAQIVLLLWFFLDMTGLYFGENCLVTTSYKDDGIFFIIYFVIFLIFIFKEKIGKWLTAVWLSIWFLIQFLCHEWYTIFNSGIMGSLDGKIKFFSETMKWLSIDGKYIPDLYHTILHLLIITALVSTLIYIVKNKKGRQI